MIEKKLEQKVSELETANTKVEHAESSAEKEQYLNEVVEIEKQLGEIEKVSGLSDEALQELYTSITKEEGEKVMGEIFEELSFTEEISPEVLATKKEKIIEHAWSKKPIRAIAITASLFVLLTNQSCANRASGGESIAAPPEISAERPVKEKYREMINSLGGRGSRPAGIYFMRGGEDFDEVLEILKKYDVQDAEERNPTETLSERLFRLLRTTEISDAEFKQLFDYAESHNPENQFFNKNLHEFH